MLRCRRLSRIFPLHLRLLALGIVIGGLIGAAAPYFREHQLREPYPREHIADESIRHFRELPDERRAELRTDAWRSAAAGAALGAIIAAGWPLYARLRRRHAHGDDRTDDG